MVEPGSGSAWSVDPLSPLQSCAGCSHLPKTGRYCYLPLLSPPLSPQEGELTVRRRWRPHSVIPFLGPLMGGSRLCREQVLTIYISRGNVLQSVSGSVFQGHTCSKSQERVCGKTSSLFACHIRPESWRPFVFWCPYQTGKPARSWLVLGWGFRLIFLPGSIRPTPGASPAPTMT